LSYYNNLIDKEHPYLFEAIALLQHNNIGQTISAPLRQEIEQNGATNFRLSGEVLTTDLAEIYSVAEEVRLAQVVWSSFVG
jgi:hypothetical protein